MLKIILNYLKHLFPWLPQSSPKRPLKVSLQPKLKPQLYSDPELAEALQSGQTMSVSTAAWLKGELIQEVQRFVLSQRSPHTARAYESDLKGFVGFLRAQKVPGDSFDALLEYRNWMVRSKDQGGAGLSRLSANRKFATIRSFLSWLQSRGKIQENPSLWIKNYRAKTESPTKDFTDSEAGQVLALPNLKTRSGLMHSVLLHMLFYLGLRRSEVIALRGDHFTWSRAGDSSQLTVRIPGKGDKERTLPVPAKLELLLLDYFLKTDLKIGEKKFLFSPVKNNVTKLKEKALNSNSIYYIVKRYSKLAGIEKNVSPHSCRATCISNALDHSASHRAVQEMAGWSSPLMIERYDKRRTKLQDSAVHVIDY